MPTVRRRSATETSATRAQLLDTAEAIMKEEGYPAVTTRRLASRMGVSNQLVHYYFRTMDDLFLSLMRRGAERNVARLIQAVTSADPLRALLEIYNDHDDAQLQVEFMALINHRKEISKEAARSSEHMRALEAEALARVLSDYGVEASELPATGLAVILSAIGRIMAIEKSAGIGLGHAEAAAIVERTIKSFERKRGQAPKIHGKRKAARSSKRRTRQ